MTGNASRPRALVASMLAAPAQRRARPAVLVCLVALAASCITDDEIGTPLFVELIGPETGLVGDQLSVLYNVSGRSLTGIIFTWGDGAVDSLGTVGAQTASGSMQHVYEMPGLFTVRAVVEDAVEGVASAEVSINVQGR
ncbi:MAG: PKD domain-containing protein [Gemmatimonadetes bacterium]|nr:PKD domain-containing protein [Gemmatimonadota bacterium]